MKIKIMLYTEIYFLINESPLADYYLIARNLNHNPTKNTKLLCIIKVESAYTKFRPVRTLVLNIS